jgi:hypothetical protein
MAGTASQLALALAGVWIATGVAMAIAFWRDIVDGADRWRRDYIRQHRRLPSRAIDLAGSIVTVTVLIIAWPMTLWRA